MTALPPFRLFVGQISEVDDSTQGELPVSDRRRFLRAGFVLMGGAWVPTPVWAAATSATASTPTARLWPAKEYTRLVIETPREVTFQMEQLDDPHRLVLDMQNIELGSDLMALPSRLKQSDPYISGVRLGRRDRQVLRLVLDLKDRIDPQIFSLKPVANFGYRLVLDIYPVERVDPLLALVKEFEASDNVPALEQKYADDDALLLLVREYEKRAATENVAVAGTSPESRKKPEAPAGKTPANPPAAGTTKMPATTSQGKTGATGATSATGAADKGGTDKGGSVDKGSKGKPPASPKKRAIVVMLDPGHGGEDPGAIGRKKTLEKNVVLAIAKQVKKLIDAEPNMRAALTRDGDFFVPLNQRVEKARRVQADLMVSIHADAFSNQSARGSSVFALSERGATSAAARWLAQKENDADLVGGVNIDAKDAAVARTLLDLSQSAQISDSLRVGSLVLTALGTHNALHKGDVEQAGFAVLKAPDIPSILVETAFLSNPEEEAKLRDPKEQQRFAQSIADGIKRYFALNPPLARL